MRMKALLLATIFMAFQAQAAESIVLEVKRLENRDYNTVTTTITSNEFNIKAPKETMDQFEASGVKLPLTVKQEQTVVNTLKTSAARDNGDIPFTGTLETKAKVESSAKQANQSTQKRFELAGAYREGVLAIDSVKGDGVTPELEDAIKKALVKVMQSVQYSKDPIKVGDTFSQAVPVSIPMQGAAPVQMLMTTHYTLKSIKGKQANFDIKQEYGLAPGATSSAVTINGSGTGTMLYDGALYEVTSMATNSTMNMTVQSGEMQSIVKTVTGTDIKTTVKPNK